MRPPIGSWSRRTSGRPETRRGPGSAPTNVAATGAAAQPVRAAPTGLAGGLDQRTQGAFQPLLQVFDVERRGTRFFGGRGPDQAGRQEVADHLFGAGGLARQLQLLDVQANPAADAPLGDRTDMVYMNTNVTRGIGELVVTTTGMSTEVGHISHMLQSTEDADTPLTVQLKKLTNQILQTNGNEKDPRAGGGTCFGDSGGPVLKDGYLTADTSYGFTNNCRYLGGYQRVDIPIVRDWLLDCMADLACPTKP